LVEPAVAPDDVRDGLDLALRPFDVIVDIEVKQSVDVLVDQRSGEAASFSRSYILTNAFL
jgi:hypothetical protein